MKPKIKAAIRRYITTAHLAVMVIFTIAGAAAILTGIAAFAAAGFIIIASDSIPDYQPAIPIITAMLGLITAGTGFTIVILSHERIDDIIADNRRREAQEQREAEERFQRLCEMWQRWAQE